MSTDLVLFDLDGTLLDSSRIIIGAQELTAEAHGLPHPGRERGFAVVGLSLDVALAELFGDAVPAHELSVTYKRIFNGLRGTAGYEEPLFEGIADMLSNLSRWPDTVLGIATGKTLRGVEYVVETFGWQGLFAMIQTADNSPSKPHPGMIHQAMEKAGAGPQRTVMVGDSVHDMRMARAAGVTAIAVSWGFQPAAMLVEAGADLVARTTADLAPMIASALRRPVPALV
ncbi:MAG: HAD-IA family hydrolase [Beijerinckiaceae bacterium]|jgi:phosphoglycolate phosphatase|nr:HAD-IA family hydrolase [Beijerinckiaceae bacterium]